MYTLCAALENNLPNEHQSGERCSLSTPVPASRSTCLMHCGAERSFCMPRPAFNGIHRQCALSGGSDLYLVGAEVPEQGIVAGIHDRMYPQVLRSLHILGDVIDI